MSWFDLFQDTVLKQLVVTAINENRDVRIAAATVQEYQADLRGRPRSSSRRSRSPANRGARSRRSETFPGPMGTLTFTIPPQNYLEALGNVSWELDFWGRLRNARTEARANLLAQEQSRRVGLADPRRQRRHSDISSCGSWTSTSTSPSSTLASRQETYRLSQDKFDRGAIAELDLRQFEGDVGDAAASVATYKKMWSRRRINSVSCSADSPAPIPRGRPLNEVLNAIDLPVGIPSQLLERRPDVRAAEAELQAATAAVGVAIDARLPTISITGDWGFENFSATHYIPQGQFITRRATRSTRSMRASRSRSSISACSRVLNMRPRPASPKRGTRTRRPC